MPVPPAALLRNLFAEGRKYELNTASDIKDVLKENIGNKIVYIKLGSGEELDGWVVKVGDHLVQCSNIQSQGGIEKDSNWGVNHGRRRKCGDHALFEMCGTST